MSRILATIAVFLILPCFVFADFDAEIFELGSGKSKKIITFSSQTTEKDGVSELVTVYKDLDGKVLVEENAKLNKTELIKMNYTQNQMKQTASIEVQGDKVIFTKTIDGKVKTEDETLRKPLVISSSFARFVKDNWDQVLAGKKVSFRYGSWERMETVGFEIFKIGEGKIADQPIVEVKMKASSFIISALVDPLTFKFASDGSKILEMNGRVAPKKADGKSWKDLDGDVVYKHL